MSRLIVPNNLQDYIKTGFKPTWDRGAAKLPLDCPCQVYPRVSTTKQKDNISALMQQDKCLAIGSGWKDEDGMIIMDTSDLGLSGQLRMDERPAFIKMLERIRSGAIKAIIASQVDRLFRDRWGVEYSKFMKICFEYGVVVVTPDFIYDFSIDWHVDRFRRRCEEAWAYIQRQIYERALPAQDYVGFSGRWTGGYLPTGLYVDNREYIAGVKNKDYLKIFPFEPWRERVNWVFQRFRMNGGNVNSLLREISKYLYLFPVIDKNDIPEGAFFKIACTPVKKTDPDGKEQIVGYTITTHKGLRNFLCQPMLAGYGIYKKILIRPNNHEAIVDHVTFLYAFNKLSPVLLSGEPNPVYEKYKHTKSIRPDHQAILLNVIESGNPGYKVYPHSRGGGMVTYSFYPKKGTVNPADLSKGQHQIPTREIDDTFLSHFMTKLRNSDFSDYIEQGETEEQLEQKTQIENAKTQISALEQLKQETRAKIKRLKNPDLIEDLETDYEAYQQDIIRLQSELSNTREVVTKAQGRRTYKRLMHEVEESWEEVVHPDEVPVMIGNFVDKVVLTILSPRFYKLTTCWSDPEWGIEEAICIRKHHTSTWWTSEEDEILKQCYPSIRREEILKKLPNRTWKAMIFRAIQLEVRRDIRECSSVCPTLICWNDWMTMQKYNITNEEFFNGTFCPKFGPGDNKLACNTL